MLRQNLKSDVESDTSVVDDVMDKLQSVFLVAAHASAKVKRPPRARLKNKKKHPPRRWFNDDCHEMKSKLQSLASKLNSNEHRFDSKLQECYFSLRKRFKSLCRMSKSVYLRNLYSQLDSMKNSDPKRFWNIYNDIVGIEKTQKQNPIDPSEWFSHFTKLFNSPLNASESSQTSVDDFLKSGIVDFQSDEVLGKVITMNELQKCIASLKNGKASGIDGILNEMFKSLTPNALCLILELFNVILSSGIFPSSWRTNIISPLHKKGDVNLVENYRPIALGSNFGKLFLSILLSRLNTFVDANSLVPREQIGFTAKARTSDHNIVYRCFAEKNIFAVLSF